MKKVKGKSTLHVVIFIILFISIIVVVLFLFKGCGLGFGKGTDGDGGNNSETGYSDMSGSETKNRETASSTSSTTILPTTAITIETILEINITISESNYYYENNRYDLDGIAEKLSEIKSKYTVLIHDDNASQKAYNELTKILDAKNIKYSED